MYASITSPLPPNSVQPYPRWIINRDRRKRAQIELAALTAKAAVECAPDPASFASMGPQIMADVLRAPQNASLTGPTALSAPASTPTPTAPSNPPTVVPLNQPAGTGLLPAPSAPRGSPVTNKSGTSWGNSPIVPPSIPALIKSVPGWFWIAAGIAGLMSVGSIKRIRF